MNVLERKPLFPMKSVFDIIALLNVFVILKQK